MYENNAHTVSERIVSISQPYIRSIVRGKAVAPVEFGAKLDLSIDENGMARLERLTKKQNIVTVQRVWRSNGHSVWLSGVMD